MEKSTIPMEAVSPKGVGFSGEDWSGVGLGWGVGVAAGVVVGAGVGWAGGAAQLVAIANHAIEKMRHNLVIFIASFVDWV